MNEQNHRNVDNLCVCHINIKFPSCTIVWRYYQQVKAIHSYKLVGQNIQISINDHINIKFT
jgi:hypothetical protein